MSSSAPPPYSVNDSQLVAQQADTMISLTINGQLFEVNLLEDHSITPTTGLGQFIREKTKWKGTKISCYEGGCGACTVALTYYDATQGKEVTRAVHSCLRPLLACNGMSVTTNDGLRAPDGGPHPIQKALAEGNGAQCGYCSNGFVMSTYCLLEENPKPTPLQVEEALHGNLCRCTGYRPILDAMKSVCATADQIEKCRSTCNREGIFKDIEELKPFNFREKHGPYVHRSLQPHKGAKPKIAFERNGMVWRDCVTLDDLNYWVNWYHSLKVQVMLVVGQTSLSASWDMSPVRLYIGGIPELRQITKNALGISIGAAATIANVIDFFEDCADDYLIQAASHFRCIAGPQIRNVGSIVGNLMLTRASQNSMGFVSDVATVLMGLSASVGVYYPLTNQHTTLSLKDFFSADLSGKYIVTVNIPWVNAGAKFMTYRAPMRRVNDLSILNAAMMAVVDPTTKKITAQPTICYGGISTCPIRMSSIEKSLVGIDVTDNAAFQIVAKTLETALKPTGYMQEFKKSVALSCFYKFFLSLQPDLPPKLQSATSGWMTKGVTTGSTSFTPDPSEYPVSIGMPRIEAIQLTTGKAVYTEDVPAPSSCLYGVCVAATQAVCDIESIDSSGAEKVEGFVAFFSAKDIDPAANVWQNGDLFCKGHVLFAGQMVGVVVGTTEPAAYAAANAVKITYKNSKPPVTDIRTAVTNGQFYPDDQDPPPIEVGDVDAALKTCDHVVTGEAEIGEQYHVHLENQITTVTPVEDTLQVLTASQQPIGVQGAIAPVVQMPASKITVKTKQCGGAFGGKITNMLQPAIIAAFCAKKLDAPVRVSLGMQDNMASMGARGSRLLNYTLGFNNDGSVVAFRGVCYSNCGVASMDEAGGAFMTSQNMDNCYKIPNVDLTGKLVYTDTPATTPMRGPGWVPAVILSEILFSRVASELQMDPKAVREKNFFKRGDVTASGQLLRYWSLPDIWAKLQVSASYGDRVNEVNAFNAANRWTKRGLAITPVRFGVVQMGSNFNSIVSIYVDGSIGVTHGGTELGQGIHTKVTQVCAKQLGLTKDDLPLITINDTTTQGLPAPSNVTGGSVTSELCSLSVMHACEELNRRLAPFRKPGMKWQELIGAAVQAGADLTVTGWTNVPPTGTESMYAYNSNAASVTEVEIDVLTGQWNIHRLDIVFDVGISMNPLVDIGQIQGGFTMGMGYVAMEEVLFEPSGGSAICNSTWMYKVPSSADVPDEFNVTLLPNTPNPVGVLSSKAVGEPPVCLSAGVVSALASAITAARSDAGLGTKPWVCAKTPLRTADIQQACGTAISQFVFNTGTKGRRTRN